MSKSPSLDLPILPELPYSIRQHKLSITIIWTLLAIDSVILPLALFYPLWYATDLEQAIIFAITTSVFGIISGCEWAYRSWQLLKKNDVRPLGVGDGEGRVQERISKGGWRKRFPYWGFDFFHVAYSTGYFIVLAELIVGAAPHQPFVRVCSAPSPSFITIFGIILLTISSFHYLNIPAPFRISSQPKGSKPVKPATFTILEDVLSVDTGVGRKYRRALQERYDASRDFRRLLRQMDLFWGIPAFLVGVAILAAVGHPKVEQTRAYALGWGVPPIWAALWAMITTIWVKIALRLEKKNWAQEKRESV